MGKTNIILHNQRTFKKSPFDGSEKRIELKCYFSLRNQWNSTAAELSSFFTKFISQNVKNNLLIYWLCGNGIKPTLGFFSPLFGYFGGAQVTYVYVKLYNTAIDNSPF